MGKYDEISIINRDFLIKERTLMRQKRQNVRKELSRLPEGHLRMGMDRGNVRPNWIRYENGRRTKKIIGKNQDLVYKLAHKEYLKEELTRLEKNLAALDYFLEHVFDCDEDTILNLMPSNYDLLQRDWVVYPALMKKDFYYPKPVFDGSLEPQIARLNIGDFGNGMTPEYWASMPYCANTFDGRIHFSRKGVKTRSKSEAMLLDLYDELGIFYHYDENLSILGRRISPDIVGARLLDGALIYHEHLGLMSEEYRSHFQYKTSLYMQNGILPGKNLILTYDNEDGAINLQLIEQIVRDVYFG